MLLTNRAKLSDLSIKFLKFQLNIKSVSPHTYKSYAKDLEQFIKNLDSFDSEIPLKNTAETLTRIRFTLAKWSNLSAATRNRKTATVKSFLKWLYSEGFIQTDLNQLITCPKVPRKTPHFISVDEVLSLHQYFQNKIPSAETEKDRLKFLIEACLFLLLYGGALRVSEACGARWLNFNKNQRSLVIDGKGGKQRIVILPDRVVKNLQLLPPTKTFILSATDKPLCTTKAYNIIKKAGQNCGLLNPLSPHALRHSLATHMLTGGMNLRTLQKFLGHTSLTATEKYTHLSIENLQNTLNSAHPIANKKVKL